MDLFIKSNILLCNGMEFEIKNQDVIENPPIFSPEHTFPCNTPINQTPVKTQLYLLFCLQTLGHFQNWF